MDGGQFTTAVELMGSEVIRVCVTDGGDFRDSDLRSSFSSPKIDDFNSTISHGDAESCRKKSLLSRVATETEVVSLGLDHGIAGSSMASMSVSDGRETQRKVRKVPRNGSVSFKKLRMLQTENLLPQSEAANDTKMELDKLGMPLLKCSNTGRRPSCQKWFVDPEAGE